MKIIFSGDYREIQKGASILFEEAFQEENGENCLTVSAVHVEGRQLSVEKHGSSCQIKYPKKAAFFRGLSLLLEHAKEQDYELHETIAFCTNGCMLDCSRNAVLKVEKIRDIIRKMALLGLDRLMLYTEDTYEVPGHPYFGAYRGRYTKEELRECDDYADIFGIEIIPCIQTLAHLHNVLKWPEFIDLQDTKDIILVGEQKTYALLREMIAAASVPYRSRKIHLGMDEAAMLGFGNYFRKNGYQSAEMIMKEHLEQVYSICEELGLEPMIWSDMYITSNTKRGYYDTPKNVDTSDWVKPPKGLGLVYWDYYHHEEEVYENNLKVHMEIAGNVVFAGGSWIWNGVAPNLEKAVDSSAVALNVCKNLGIQNVICTFWQDNGAETTMEAGYPIMALFAEAGYGHEVTDGRLRAAFARCFDGSYDDFLLLSEFDHIDKENQNNEKDDTPSKFLLYQDILLGIFDRQIEGFEITAHYQKLNRKLKHAVSNNPGYLDLFAYYLTLSEILMLKGEMGIRLKSAYDSGNEEELREIADVQIPECCKLLDELRLQRENIWMADCKPFGFELLDIRFGGTAVRMSSAARRIHSYLSGEIERIEELEEPRLLYRYPQEGKTKGLCWESFWQNIISGCDLSDTI